MTITIRLANERRVEATYLRHLRTIPGGCISGDAMDVDLVQLADGGDVCVGSPAGNGRAVPWELEGWTAESSQWVERY